MTMTVQEQGAHLRATEPERKLRRWADWLATTNPTRYVGGGVHVKDDSDCPICTLPGSTRTPCAQCRYDLAAVIRKGGVA